MNSAYRYIQKNFYFFLSNRRLTAIRENKTTGCNLTKLDSDLDAIVLTKSSNESVGNIASNISNTSYSKSPSERRNYHPYNDC